MVKSLQLLKGSRFGSWLISVVCASVLVAVLVSTTPRQVWTPRQAAAQGITEYGAILAFVAVLVGLVFSLAPEGVHDVKRLNAAILSAQRANSRGDSAKEISQLSKGISTARR